MTTRLSSFVVTRFTACGGVLLALAGAGCIGRSASQPGGASATADFGPAQAANAPAGAKLANCAGKLVPAGDGLIDDFEDGNTQLLNIAERDGPWWKHHDPNGSAFVPDELILVGPGAGDSEKALHATGKLGSGEEAYGASVGTNFTSGNTYDASPYVAVRFKAKVDPGTVSAVRFKIGDKNTHKDAGVCKSCWNHFGKDLTLTTAWKEYVVTFAELQQGAGWGDPRPPTVTPDALYSLDWSIPAKGASFGLWLDDVEFLACQ